MHALSQPRSLALRGPIEDRYSLRHELSLGTLGKFSATSQVAFLLSPASRKYNSILLLPNSCQTRRTLLLSFHPRRSRTNTIARLGGGCLQQSGDIITYCLTRTLCTAIRKMWPWPLPLHLETSSSMINSPDL